MQAALKIAAPIALHDMSMSLRTAMSKKPKRSRHRIPAAAFELKSDPISERYQAEIDASMARLEQRYRKAAKALAAAEAKAERVRAHIERMAAQQAETTRIAAHRAEEQSRLLEYIENIRKAAQTSRVASTRADLERQHAAAIAKRNAATAARKVEAKAVREREREIALARRHHDQLLLIVEDRRRELREIKRLMIPDNYANRDSRRRIVRHEPGGITIPLGATTGERPKPLKIPVFPVLTKQITEPEPEYDFSDIYGEDW